MNVLNHLQKTLSSPERAHLDANYLTTIARFLWLFSLCGSVHSFLYPVHRSLLFLQVPHIFLLTSSHSTPRGLTRVLSFRRGPFFFFPFPSSPPTTHALIFSAKG